MRIAFVPLFRELLQRRRSLFFRGGLVDPPEIFGHGLAFFPGHIPEGVADLIDDAFLDLGPREDGLDGLRDSLEIVYCENQDVLHPAILQLIKNREPVLGRFGLGDPQPQAFLLEG